MTARDGTSPPDVSALLAAIPRGTSTGRAQDRPYVVTRTTYNADRSMKLVAEERGGNDYISLNFYDLRAGPLLKPCEMPVDKVITFLRSYKADPT